MPLFREFRTNEGNMIWVNPEMVLSIEQHKDPDRAWIVFSQDPCDMVLVKGSSREVRETLERTDGEERAFRFEMAEYVASVLRGETT